MLTSIRGIVAATLVAGSAMLATPAFAEDKSESDISISGNASVVSEYRFRGVGLSGGDIAVQGGIDVGHSSGFYVGTWGSSLADCGPGTIADACYGSVELDLYGGWSGDIADGITADVGAIYYAYPNSRKTVPATDYDYIEFYASLGFTVGPAEATVGVAYAPDQNSLGSTDNIYVYTDLGVDIPDTPLSLSAHLGYTDGFLTYTADGKAFDWSVGASLSLTDNLSVGVSYVGVEGGNVDGVTDDAVVATLSVEF
ncbi:MAG: TorF family putative porin [Novosphingobium sp.]|nr:TorF family putative porin [Novosphingobium sp.]